MSTKNLNLHLPSFYAPCLDADRAPLRVLRAALVVTEQILEFRCRYDTRVAHLRDTAHLLRGKIQEVTCFLDAYELKLDSAPNRDNDDIPF